MQQLSLKEHFQQRTNRELRTGLHSTSLFLFILFTLSGIFHFTIWTQTSFCVMKHFHHVSPSMQNVYSKPLEFSVIFYMPIITLKPIEHVPLCASHWISYHFCYFGALLNLHCPIPQPWPPFAATLFSLHQVESPSSPLGSISASFLQLLIHFFASVIPGLNVCLFTAATSWSGFLKNRTPFWGEAIILAIGT